MQHEWDGISNEIIEIYRQRLFKISKEREKERETFDIKEDERETREK